ncbi:MAG: PhoH family protein, partial [Paludibacteraceae bacterium]|nr:PhoH family protein [Paludibacteraceae bacterium]
MTERVIEISEDVDPVVVYGVNNGNIQLVKNLCPKIVLLARGRIMKVRGEKADVDAFEHIMKRMIDWGKRHNELSEEKIVQIVKGEVKEDDLKEEDSLILFGVNGKKIMARTKNQKKLKDDFEKYDLMFATGPAGSGKTYTAIALAVNALKNKAVRKIVLSRPAVEAGEKLGFLPGDMKEKIDPYLQPLYDALEDMIPA